MIDTKIFDVLQRQLRERVAAGESSEKVGREFIDGVREQFTASLHELTPELAAKFKAALDEICDGLERLLEARLAELRKSKVRH